MHKKILASILSIAIILTTFSAIGVNTSAAAATHTPKSWSDVQATISSANNGVTYPKSYIYGHQGNTSGNAIVKMSKNDIAIINDSHIGWHTNISIFSTEYYNTTNPQNTRGTLDTAQYSANSNAKIDRTQITATATIPSPTFTVMIPGKIDFGTQTQALGKYRNEAKDQFGKDVIVSAKIVVTATGVSNLFDDLGKKAQLDIAATFDKKLTGGKVSEKAIEYIVKKNDAEIQSGAIIGSFYNDFDLADKGLTENKITANATINRADIQNADTYTGTMTFTISQPIK